MSTTLLRKKIFAYFFLLFVEAFAQAEIPTNYTEETINFHTTESTHLSEWLEKAQKNIVKKILPNGLTVLCYALPDTFKVKVGITYKVGSKDEQLGEYGLAHMVEHMIFKGTEKMSEADLRAIAAKFCIGKNGYNAHTTHDQTTYFFNTDKLNWPVFLNILADCMFNARFDENHFASEVKAVINELNMRQADPGSCIVDMIGEQLLPAYHPYAHSIGGNKPDLLRATHHNLKNFYKRHYHPSQATLIIVGDIDIEKTLEIAEETFKAYPINSASTNHISDLSLWASDEIMQKKITLYKPIPQPCYAYVWLIPSEDNLQEVAAATHYALYYRLSKILKDELDLVYSLDIGTIFCFLQGHFYISFEPKNYPDKTAIKTIKKIITLEINQLTRDGATEEELQRFKKTYEIGFLHSFESCESISSNLENNYFPHRNELELFHKLKRAQTITNDAVKSFCSKNLQSTTAHRFCCLPIANNELPAWLNKQQARDTYEQKILAQKIRESEIEEAALVHQLPEPQLLEFSTHEPDTVVTLSNGLTVYLKFRDTTPFISTALHFKNSELLNIYHARNKQEHIVNFAMSELTQASVNYSKEETRNFFHEHGASYSFETNGGSFSCLAENYSRIGTRFMHILTAPEFPEKILNQHIQNSIDALNDAQENPVYIATKILTKHLFKAYSWVRDDQEVIQELATITRADLFTFNKQFVHPSNMFAVVVGNYDTTTIINQLEQIFSTWKTTEDAIIPDLSTIVIPTLEDQSAYDTDFFLPKEQVIIVAGRITPEFETHDRMALKLIEQYLNQRLFEIREKTGLFYGIGSVLAGQSFHTKDMGRIQLQVSVENVTHAETAIKEILADIAVNGIPSDQLTIAKQIYQMSIAKGRATNDDLVADYIYLVGSGKAWNHLETCIQKINAISNEEVNAIAQKYLNPNSWSFVKVGRVGA